MLQRENLRVRVGSFSGALEGLVVVAFSSSGMMVVPVVVMGRVEGWG